MRFRSGAAIVLTVALSACGAAPPAASPPDPPQARADAYSPFRAPLDTLLLMAGQQIEGQLRGTARCTEIRILSLPAAETSGVAAHYARALGRDWQPVAIVPPPAMSAAAFRRGPDVLAAAVSRDVQDGRAGLVIVTNTSWDKDSSDDRARCLAR